MTEDWPDCPLCGEPIDYCPGHGEWNESDEVPLTRLDYPCEVWHDGRPRMLTRVQQDEESRVTLHFATGPSAMVPVGYPLHTLTPPRY